MEVLKQIQADLLRDDVPRTTVLRKAKVLAYELHSDELNKWGSQELDGYETVQDLPDYRVLHTGCTGQWTNGYWMMKHRGVPLFQIQDDRLRSLLTEFPVLQGIRTVEQLAKTEGVQFGVPPDILALVNGHVAMEGYGYTHLQWTIGQHNFEQILDTVRTRLLDFVLKLGESWVLESEPLTPDKVEKLVSVHIYNNPQGGQMSIFDQRNQRVEYQYNAAGNINIAAVQNQVDMVRELEKLQEEVIRAGRQGILDEDAVIDADYQVKKAIQEAKKPKPDKKSVLEHLGQAASLLKDVTAAAALVKGLIEVAEVAKNLF